ncbi:MAG: hypothetical protein ACI91V_000480 [Lentimonas sp.]|jgi:hypothetical protein
MTDQVSQSLPTGGVPLSYFRLNLEKWQSGRSEEQSDDKTGREANRTM